MSANPLEHQECAGRFSFSLPDGLAVASRSLSIYRVDVSTTPIRPGGFQAFWDARLAKLFPLGLPSANATDGSRIFDLSPGTRAVWYVADPTSPRIRTLEGVKAISDYVVSASRSGEAGKESNVEFLVHTVLDSFVPANDLGFCIGPGAITSEPGSNESVLVSFENRKIQGFKMRFETRTVAEPDTNTYSDVQEDKDFAKSSGAQLSILRDGSRTVGGLDGKEISTSLSPPGDTPLIRSTWHFPGIPHNSFKPTINIVATAPAGQRAELERIWDVLLNSVQPVPPSAQRAR